jgi:hypothetical protein
MLCYFCGQTIHTTMKKNKGTLTLIGFILIALGFLAIILSMVGLRFTFLSWIDAPGALFGFAIRLLMVITGFVLVYFAQSDFAGED